MWHLVVDIVLLMVAGSMTLSVSRQHFDILVFGKEKESR